MLFRELKGFLVEELGRIWELPTKIEEKLRDYLLSDSVAKGVII